MIEQSTGYEEEGGRDASPITQGMQMLDKEAGALTDLVEVLSRRLSPVLSPSEIVEMTGSGEVQTQPALRAGLTQHLIQTGDVFREARVRLASITERLEI